MKLIFSILCSFILLVSCKKMEAPEPEYPSTLECLLDGKPFYDKSNSNLSLEVYGVYKGLLGSANVTAKLREKINEEKTITKELITVNIPKLEEGRQRLYSAKFIIFDDLCGEYSVNRELFTNLRITSLDSAAQIIKGKFNFTGINNCDKDESVNITFGEFDVKYRKY